MQPSIEKIRQYVADCAGMPVGSVRNDSHLNTDIGLDSLDVLELVMAVEDEFEIIIEDEDSVRCKTVAELAAIVDAQTSQRAAQLTFFPAGSLQFTESEGGEL